MYFEAKTSTYICLDNIVYTIHLYAFEKKHAMYILEYSCIMFVFEYTCIIHLREKSFKLEFDYCRFLFVNMKL